MESESFVYRLNALNKKSPRALRLYSTAGGSSYNRVEGTIGELPSVQVAEWREINGLLLRKLTEAAEAANTKKIIYDVFALRNEFQTLWRTTEAELVQSQRDLIASAESGDFIRAATLATNLVSLKARLQAGQAAHHELDLLIKRSKVVRPAAELSEEGATVLSTLELLDEQVIKESVSKPEPLRAAAGGGKVIPLKRR
jgi:hypothetical protein